MSFVTGIDMGDKSTKVLILDEEKRIQGRSIVKTRVDFFIGSEVKGLNP